MRYLFLLAALLPAAAQDVRKITILHSNDLHARLLPDSNQLGGFAHLATAVRNERKGCTGCLYVHAGDLVQGTPVSTLFKGTPVYHVANKLKFDAHTLGNHEFDYAYTQIPVFLKAAKFPVVSANIVDERGKLMAPRPYLIKKVNGVRVAILGAAMTDLVQGFLTPRTAGPYRALPVVETMAKYAKEARGKADLVVVLGHIHQKEGSQIIQDVPEVNVVVEGHNHAGRKELEQVDGRVAVGCQGYGRDLCKLELEVDRKQKKLVSWKWTRIPIEAKRIAAAKDVQKQVDKWEKKVAEMVDVKIGESRREFNQAEFRPLIEKAMLEEMKADFTHMNSGGVRDRLPRGEIRARHIWNIMPFDNRMMTAKVKGAAIPAALRKDKRVEAEREYTIALPDYVATNESQVKSLGIVGIRFAETDIYLRDVIIEWVKKQKVLQ
ncbi:MAG: bifunctional metallophosphatase/5'-nucleotidase [Bryobacterales bacterium]|nr:bifunctional metallophosphatase/5'-nucleotidase [Bryobacterales bacterium]